MSVPTSVRVLARASAASSRHTAVVTHRGNAQLLCWSRCLLRCPTVPASCSPFLLPSRCMANKEQRNKDKANMKKKAEKSKAATSRPSSPGSASHATADLDPALLALLDGLDTKAALALSHLSDALSLLSVSRLSPSLLDDIPVHLTPIPAPPTPLRALATIQPRSSASLLVTLHDPATLKAVQRALSSTTLPGLGALTPQVEGEGGDGSGVRLTVAMGKVGKDTKEEMKAGVRKRGEDCKGQLRALRQAVLVGLKKASATEEHKERTKGRMQALVDETTAEIDRRVKAKEADINDA